MCDECAGEIPRGGVSTYHVRTGRAYCVACADALGARRA
jgi:hypothetical protein